MKKKTIDHIISTFKIWISDPIVIITLVVMAVLAYSL